MTKPRVGKISAAAQAAVMPAMTHDSVDIRPTKMPAARAAGGLTAAARMAIPKRV